MYQTELIHLNSLSASAVSWQNYCLAPFASIRQMNVSHLKEAIFTIQAPKHCFLKSWDQQTMLSFYWNAQLETQILNILYYTHIVIVLAVLNRKEVLFFNTYVVFQAVEDVRRPQRLLFGVFCSLHLQCTLSFFSKFRSGKNQQKINIYCSNENTINQFNHYMNRT